MKKSIFLIAAAILLLSAQTVFAQVEELAFIEIRQKLADNLTSVKNAVKNNNWTSAQESLKLAKEIWESKVLPMVLDGRKEEIEKARAAGVENPENIEGKFKEYSDRVGEVQANLEKLAQLLISQKGDEIETTVNATIWAISHQPRGFNIPHRTYSVWDWTFGLGIGLGFCLFAVVSGLYLRRSYYRRYPKMEL